MKATPTSKGQITFPAAIRSRLGLEPGQGVKTAVGPSVLLALFNQEPAGEAGLKVLSQGATRGPARGLRRHLRRTVAPCRSGLTSAHTDVGTGPDTPSPSSPCAEPLQGVHP